MIITLRNLRYLFSLLLGVFVVQLSFAQEWQNGEGFVTLGNITREAARSQALDLARQNALEQLQVEVVGGTIRQMKDLSGTDYYDHFAQYCRTSTRGRIIKEEITFDDLVNMHNTWFYKIKLRAQVVMDTELPDPEFTIEINTKDDRTSYRDGERIQLMITASKDCYVTVFNIYSNDSLLVVIPNQLMRDNFVPANGSLMIPPERSFWLLEVGILPGKEKDMEAFMVVATRDNVPFRSSGDLRQELLSLDGGLLAINKWLVEIPANKRTEDIIYYNIHK